MIIDLKYKIYAAIAVVIIAVFTYFVYTNYELKNELYKTQTEYKVSAQNLVATQDQLKLKTDSLQNVALFVDDLNQKNSDLISTNAQLKNAYVLVKSSYSILRDSFVVIGNAYTKIIGDSVYVTFLGYKKGIHYNGFTLYNLDSKKSNYELSLVLDTSKINSIIFIDSTKTFIRNLVYIDNELITEIKTTIDKKLFINIINDGGLKRDTTSFLDNLSLKLGIFGISDYSKVITTDYGIAMSAFIDYKSTEYNVYAGYVLSNRAEFNKFQLGLQHTLTFKKFLSIF
jgi:hypothetical protein